MPGPGRKSFKEIYGEPAARFPLRLPASLYSAVEAAAEIGGVSMNAYLITLIDAAIRAAPDDAQRPNEQGGGDGQREKSG